MTEEYSFHFLHFNKGWSVVSVQNTCSSSPSSRQRILTRAQSRIDEGQQIHVASIQNSRYKLWIKTIYRTHKQSARVTFVEARICM